MARTNPAEFVLLLLLFAAAAIALMAVTGPVVGRILEINWQVADSPISHAEARHPDDYCKARDVIRRSPTVHMIETKPGKFGLFAWVPELGCYATQWFVRTGGDEGEKARYSEKTAYFKLDINSLDELIRYADEIGARFIRNVLIRP